MPEEQTERSQPVEQGAEKKALSTADAQAARTTSGSEVKEVQASNPNKFESMTELPTIKDGKSLEEHQQQSFGIDMGDSTAVTAKGIEAPAKKKVSLDLRPSYVEGLKAVGNDEEAQGRFSIDYMERKAKEAFDALQKLPAEQVLIASNITSTVTNFDQMQQYPEVQSDVPNEGTIAWDPRKDAKKQIDKGLYPHRENPEEWVDNEAARLASQCFPRLAAYSVRHEGIGPHLISAILQNEQTYYRSDKDAVPDAVVRRTGALPLDMTVGPAQMKVSNIKHLAQTYPDILGSASDSTHLATDKWYATMLVGAYLDDKIQTFESWSKHPPDRTKLTKDERYQYDHALPLWKAGMETKALAMSYNPAGGKDHLNNVLKHLP